MNRSTANCMDYGELGRCCIRNSVKERMVNFWSRLVTSIAGQQYFVLKYNCTYVQFVVHFKSTSIFKYLSSTFKYFWLFYHINFPTSTKLGDWEVTGASCSLTSVSTVALSQLNMDQSYALDKLKI